MARFVRTLESSESGRFVLRLHAVEDLGRFRGLIWVFVLLGFIGFSVTGVRASSFAAQNASAKASNSSDKGGGTTDANSSVSPSDKDLATAQASQVPNDTYRIGIEDDLQVSVWHEPELSTQVVVRPDGVITLPLLNDVHVVGLTPKQLQTELTAKLKNYVTEPQVTVIVRGIKSRKVYLIGEVGHTGVFQLNTRMTVLQLLAEAGGLGPYAKGDNIYVMRTENGMQKKLRFNYKKALRGDQKEDFELEPGDMVVVP